MRTMDVLLCFPTLITGIVIVAILGPSMVNVIVAITVTLIPKFARIARAPTLAVKERAFIEACRAMGFSDARNIVFHIVPNFLTEILVMACEPAVPFADKPTTALDVTIQAQALGLLQELRQQAAIRMSFPAASAGASLLPARSGRTPI